MKVVDINRKHIVLMLRYCEEKWGLSKFKPSLPKLIVRSDKSDCYGEYSYSKNILTVHINKHKKLLEVCKTVIHEYTHYLKCQKRYEYYYDVAYRNYKNHPHELTAINRELKYGKECKRYVLNNE